LIVGLALVAFAAAAVSLLLRNDRKGTANDFEEIHASTVAFQEE